MPTHIRHDDKETFYFITITCYRWINLFEETDIYDYMPFWFQKLNDKGCLLKNVNAEFNSCRTTPRESKDFTTFTANQNGGRTVSYTHTL